MKCGWTEERLLLYLAGELEPPEAARVRRHQETCPRCTALLETLAETERMVEGGLRTQVRAPATLDQRVMAGVQSLPSRRFAWPRFAPWWGWQRRFALASAALFLLIGGVVIGQWRARQGNSAISYESPQIDFSLLKTLHAHNLPKTPAWAQGQELQPDRILHGLSPLQKFSAVPVDLSPGGAHLIGGSLYPVQGEMITVLVYDWKGQRITLLQLKGPPLRLPDSRPRYHKGRQYMVGQMDGLAYVRWWAHDVELVLLSHTDPAALLRMAVSASGVPDYYCPPPGR